jgi:hypothetical protein
MQPLPIGCTDVDLFTGNPAGGKVILQTKPKYNGLGQDRQKTLQ